MSSFWRFTLLGLFGAVGIGLALCVALSNTLSADLATATSLAAPIGAEVAPVGDLWPVNDGKSGTTDRADSQPPILERTHPPITGQSPPGSLPPGQNSLLAQAPGQSAGNPPAGSQPTQAELMDQLRQQLQQALLSQGSAAAGKADISANDSSPNGAAPPKPGAAGAATKSKPRITRLSVEGDQNLAIHIQDADLRDVLELLSEQGSLNILPSPSVQGKVSASLNGVDIDTALEAILRSTGFVSKRDGRFIFVGTPQDFKAMEQSLDKIGTRLYRLNYIRAADVKALVTPLLTPGVGSVSETAPANEGIASDSSKAGGDQFAGGDSILVRDFVAVLDQIDQVISEVDRQPAQVAIEAMILQITLKDEYSFGIDFSFFRDNPNVRLVTGKPLNDLNKLDVSKGGLKFAFLDSTTGAFISALETIGDTNVIASPRLMVVNKARAEILIGEQLGYVNTTITETSTAQNVQFLEVGAQLRLRPFISSDGLIRMEVHPELSTGEVKVQDGFTLPNKRLTQVTTNIMVPDGCTLVIGGLMREDLLTNTSQVPLLGSMPGIGFLFRNKKETTEKREIVVLITPHIVCPPEACCEGDKAAADFHRRQAVYADQMSPIGKRYLGRKYYRLAQEAWAHGDQETALRFVDLAIHFDPENRASIDLRVDIWNGNLTGDHTLIKPNTMPSGEEIMLSDEPDGLPYGDAPGVKSAPRSSEPVSPGRPVLKESRATKPQAREPVKAAAKPAAMPPVAPPTAPPPAAAPEKLPTEKTQATRLTIHEAGTYSVLASRHNATAPPALMPPPSWAMPIIKPEPLERMPVDAAGLPAGAGGVKPAAGAAGQNATYSVQQTAAHTAVASTGTKTSISAPAGRASKVKMLDGEQLPAWMVDGLKQPGGAAPPRPMPVEVEQTRP